MMLDGLALVRRHATALALLAGGCAATPADAPEARGRVEVPARDALEAPTGSARPAAPDATSAPTAPGTRAWRDEAGRCWAVIDFKCPPPEVAVCHPPAPQSLACPADPKDLLYDLSAAIDPDGRIERRADGQCWTMSEVACPPTVKCATPPPQPVPCPADPAGIDVDRLAPKGL